MAGRFRNEKNVEIAEKLAELATPARPYLLELAFSWLASHPP